ncbi:MAG: crossover junction endodeoxyribonuclease RuvC [Bdellovibrionales bacterium]|nr:crossover junction endodeoxyribonuclease RuvC [Bdellovibrionales bacterium]
MELRWVGKMRVLGIDPGTLNLGWGVIERDPRGRWIHRGHDCLRAPQRQDFFVRIAELGQKVGELIDLHQPQVAVIENIFLGKNVDSAFKLGHIRGICVAECHKRGLEIFEYSPKVVKKQITGSGSAEKTLVRELLYRQLGIPLDSGKTLDASDALALAFCHIMQDSVRQRIRKAEL